MTFDVSILTKKVPFMLAGAAAAAMFVGSTAHAADSNATGYVYSPEVSTANGGWNWLENGKPYTGFRYHAGTFYWFVDGVRQNAGWRQAWGLTYYTDQDGRAVQGQVTIDGTNYDFGNDGTFYLRVPGTKTATTPGFGGAPEAHKSPDTIVAPVTTTSEPEQKQATAQPAANNTNQTTAPATSTTTRTYTGWVKNEKGDVIWTKKDFSTMKDAETTTTDYMNTHMWDEGDMEPYSYGAY